MFVPDYGIDLDWMHRISFNLERFKQASGSRTTFNARCPICGDSQTSKRKARLYFYQKHGNLLVNCKNCGYSHSFYTFMRDAFPSEFEEYKREQMLNRFKTSFTKSSPKEQRAHSSDDESPSTPQIERLSTVVDITSLPDDHPAKRYLLGRGFKEPQLSRLQYAEDFRDVIAELNPWTDLDKMFPEQRIVIPFYGLDGRIEMVQGRSLNPKSKMKYMSIKVHEDVDKVYGKYEVDREQTVYCVEGPFDSLFVRNCIATCDSSLMRRKADVYIWDNQPRNKDVVDLMSDAINANQQVVIWPTSPDTKQDINDMILSGLSTDDLMSVIEMRTFSGLRALAELAKWKRI